MPQHKSAEKRVRQNEKKRFQNKAKRSKIKTAIKKVKTAPDKETASKELKKTISILDRMALQGIIHKNKAANIKSKLSRSINSMK
jgi:small subunit ribosomal protein S20